MDLEGTLSEDSTRNHYLNDGHPCNCNMSEFSTKLPPQIISRIFDFVKPSDAQYLYNDPFFSRYAMKTIFKEAIIARNKVPFPSVSMEFLRYNTTSEIDISRDFLQSGFLKPRKVNAVLCYPRISNCIDERLLELDFSKLPNFPEISFIFDCSRFDRIMVADGRVLHRGPDFQSICCTFSARVNDVLIPHNISTSLKNLIIEFKGENLERSQGDREEADRPWDLSYLGNLEELVFRKARLVLNSELLPPNIRSLELLECRLESIKNLSLERLERVSMNSCQGEVIDLYRKLPPNCKDLAFENQNIWVYQGPVIKSEPDESFVLERVTNQLFQLPENLEKLSLVDEQYLSPLKFSQSLRELRVEYTKPIAFKNRPGTSWTDSMWCAIEFPLGLELLDWHNAQFMIMEWNIHQLNRLKHLSLSKCRQEIDFSALPTSLEHVTLKDCNISRVDVTHLAKLFHLNVDENRIASLDDVKWPASTREVSASNNQITELNGVYDLLQLSVASNRITKIGPEFSKSKILQLDICNNPIEKFDLQQLPPSLLVLIALGPSEIWGQPHPALCHAVTSGKTEISIPYWDRVLLREPLLFGAYVTRFSNQNEMGVYYSLVCAKGLAVIIVQHDRIKVRFRKQNCYFKEFEMILDEIKETRQEIVRLTWNTRKYWQWLGQMLLSMICSYFLDIYRTVLNSS